jgi:hypothetical protein
MSSFSCWRGGGIQVKEVCSLAASDGHDILSGNDSILFTGISARGTRVVLSLLFIDRFRLYVLLLFFSLVLGYCPS